MPKHFKLQKVSPFMRPVPTMPDPVDLAMAWLNAQAAEGWIRPDLTLTVDGDTVTLGPTLELRGDAHLLLEGDGTPQEYKLQAVQPFARPVPQMPDPVEMAMAWVNQHAGAGWELPPFCISEAGGETVSLDFAGAVDVRGETRVLLRRPKPADA